jgi:very-short-patch-repair endonuclease
VVEIDGDSHVCRTEYDRERTAWLKARGYTIIRFANRDVLSNMDSVLNAIVDQCRSQNRS